MGAGHGNGLDLFDTFGGGNDFGAMDDFGIPAIPEPSSRALPASGLVGDWQPLAAQDSINKFPLPDHSSPP